MICKTIEIRDANTFISALAVKLRPECEQDRYLLARAGYGTTGTQQAAYVVLVKLDGDHFQANYDPFAAPALLRFSLRARQSKDR